MLPAVWRWNLSCLYFHPVVTDVLRVPQHFPGILRSVEEPDAKPFSCLSLPAAQVNILCFFWAQAPTGCETVLTWATSLPKSEYCNIVGLLRFRLWGWFFFGITLLTQRVEAREGRWWAIEQSLERWWHHTQSLSHPIPQKNWKFERFHLDGGKVSFQNTQQIYLFPHRPQEKENWKAFTWMATKCLFKIFYKIYLFPHRPQKKGKLKGFYLDGD